MAEQTLTARQRQILECIDQSMRDRGYPPSVREIGSAVGLGSPSTVHSHLNTLQRLGFLRRDAVLWPLMLLSLVVAQVGFWQGWRAHRRPWPFLLGGVSGVSLASGVIFVHGPPAMTMIYAGAVGLVLATAWNIWARRSCPGEVVSPL